jgi:hypothetical protein
MATAKPKRMMFGGIAKGAMNSVKKAVAAKSAPMKMQNAARSAAQQAAPRQMQFMSDALRKKQLSSGSATNPPMVKPRSSPISSIQNMKKTMGDPGLTMLKAQKAGMMKKGGAVKKATKK